MKSREYLNEIRRAAGLKRAVLAKITVEGQEAVFHLHTDVNYTQEDVAYANEVTARYAPGLHASAKVTKSVPGEEAVCRAILDILRTQFPAFAAFVSPENVRVVPDGAGGRFFIGVGEIERAAGLSDGVTDALSAALGRKFCGNWLGELSAVQKAVPEIEREVPPEEFVLLPRYFNITGYTAIDGGAPKRALYIADLTKAEQDVALCGEISYIEERESKNGKPYFSFTIGDGSGSMRAMYFSKKATLEKVRGLTRGTSICITGSNELYNGNFSFRVKTIDLGSPPKGFVPEQRPSRPVPAGYRAVFPVPEADLEQADLFGSVSMPEGFAEQKYVVVDLETTGLSKGGVMDRIIEIGAVKIENGHICERFSSFVACPVRLSPEIIDITGITDDMLVGAPEIDAVIADFYKFSAGCGLVAHNTSFDCKLIRYYGDRAGYVFDHPQYDTVTLAQELLPQLKNFKLNTVADYFHFEFHHHRAYADAFVTAKIFMELVRMKGHLPQAG